MLGWFYFHASVDLSSKGELHHPCPKMEYLSNQSTKMESGKVLQPFFGICIYEEPPPPHCIDLFLVFQMNSFSTNGSKAYVLNPFSTNRRKAFIFDISICLLEMKDQWFSSNEKEEELRFISKVGQIRGMMQFPLLHISCNIIVLIS